MNTPRPSAVLVLVHGLWHGGWSWDEVRDLLTGAGVDSVAVDLPFSSLADDVAAVRAVLDGLAADGRDVVLVGHSYGGAVITAAGAHPAVRRLVYLAAFQLEQGESVNSACVDRDIPPTQLGDALRFSADRSEVSLEPDLGRELLYGDVDPRLADEALARIRPVARAVFSGRPEAIAWREVPSTYVVCADDLTVAPDLQRAMAERATRVVEIPGGHSPLTSRPDTVADLLVAEVNALG